MSVKRRIGIIENSIYILMIGSKYNNYHKYQYIYINDQNDQNDQKQSLF